MNAGHVVKAVQGYLGDSDNVATLDDAVLYDWWKFANYCGGKAVGFMDGSAAVLQAVIDANKQFIAGKGVYAAIVAHNAPRAAVRGWFSGTKDRATLQALTTTPNLIATFLMSRVNNLGFWAAIDTNHDYILSYGNRKC